MTRPTIYVLAGVNGAGKSSVGGTLLTQAGLSWYDPDAFAYALVQESGLRPEEASAIAWHEGVRRLGVATASFSSYAFETTLGGRTMTKLLLGVARTHDVLLWYCGLATVDQHIARVRARVRAGGHDIPEENIRERWTSSMQNLIVLMPRLAHLRVYDNSVERPAGAAIPEPVLVLEMIHGRFRYPMDIRDAASTPSWAKPAVETAFELEGAAR